MIKIIILTVFLSLGSICAEEKTETVSMVGKKLKVMRFNKRSAKRVVVIFLFDSKSMRTHVALAVTRLSKRKLLIVNAENKVQILDLKDKHFFALFSSIMGIPGAATHFKTHIIA